MAKCFWCDEEFILAPRGERKEITPFCSVECTDQFCEFWEGRNDKLFLNPDHPAVKELDNDD